jgi:hypothetical protein
VLTTSGSFGADRYRHYVVTYDGTNVRWYIDGQLNTTRAVTFQTNAGTDAFVVGRGDQPGKDVIDEVALYNKALSAAAVASHHQAATG